MKGKVAALIILSCLAIAFALGLLGNSLVGIAIIGSWICALIIFIVLAIYLFKYFKKKNLGSIVAGIFSAIVVLALSVAGACGLTALGLGASDMFSSLFK